MGTRLFADDCIIYKTIKNRSDCDKLQKDLDALCAWEQKWGMQFHPQKCKYYHTHALEIPSPMITSSKDTH